MPTRFDPSENLTASPELAKWYASMIDVLMNPYAGKDAKLAANLTLATDIVQNLDSYTRLPAPPKPIEIEGFHDGTLAEKVRFISASTRRSENDREILRAFCDWRYAILLLESRNCGRVEVLLHTAARLEKMGREYAEPPQLLRALSTFLDAEWNVKIPPVPVGLEAARVAYWAAGEPVLLPNTLRLLDQVALPSQSEAPRRRGGEPSRMGAMARSWVDSNERDESEEA